MGKIFGKNKFTWKPGEYYSSSKGKNAEIGSKYNVAAWEHFGKTKKLKGGFGVDGEEVQGTMKMVGRKGMKNKNNRNYKMKFREKGDLFFKNIQRDSL